MGSDDCKYLSICVTNYVKVEINQNKQMNCKKNEAIYSLRLKLYLLEVHIRMDFIFSLHF